MNYVNYQLDVSDVTAHLITVTLSFKPTQAVHELSLPAWIPGSYMIRDFARNIVSINAYDDVGSLQLTQLDKQRWQLSCNNHIVYVRYKVYANDLSVRAAYIDDEVAVLNPACLCLCVSELQTLVHHVDVIKPQADVAASWRLATGLSRASDTPFVGFGRYYADNYQILIDSPLLLGVFTLCEFSINDINHYLVVTGSNLTDLTRFTDDLTKICQQQLNVFGALPDDLDSYWFLLWVTEDGYGGLEHLNSTLLLCSRFDLPTPGVELVDENYQNLLALCSHEYFHTWWVKRLKPVCFMQYQLANEQYTSQLWLYEGFTSYFDDLALVHSGLITAESYIKTVEKLISRVTRNPSDQVQSLVDSSFTAWTKFYKQDENAVNAVVSYYAKGALLALCLEAALRQRGLSLQHVVRQLWQRFIATGTPDNALSVVLNELGLSELASQSEQWLHEAKPLPLADTLANLGLKVTLRPMQHDDDFGGEMLKKSYGPANLPFIGALTKTVNGQLTISQVYHGGAAHQAGLMVGDQLIALDNRKITNNNFNQLLQRYEINSETILHLFRKDRLLQCSLQLCQSNAQVAIVNISDQTLCDNWLTMDME
ncbi:M61 family metallopeptidase [Rheinheimera baltica]|uniref:M61 family metallopeptidase n=1 Tax=Rheinheimera baltica TaxID=67576 RepID=UPI00273EE715|nr:PDZ domain-containing protein [Rheinheimera baltica]MDP5191554.1 PDZ domain-containing protein [Rheinheimera baltica]